MEASHPTAPIPDHVPKELIHDYTLDGSCGGDFFDPHDPVGKRVKDLSTLPALFYTPHMMIPVEVDKGSWVVNSAENIRSVLQNADVFVVGPSATGNFTPKPIAALPLEAIDAEQHMKYRHLTNPFFRPSKVKEWTDNIRALAVKLIENVKQQGGCEFTTSFSQPFPVLMFMRLMGMPEERLEMLLEWEYGFLHGKGLEQRVESAHKIYYYLEELIAEERGAPRKDTFISALIHADIDGRPLTDEEVLGYCFLFFLAGLDTVTTTSEWVFKHLAEHPNLQRKLREDNSLIPDAIEELLRMYPVVSTQRKAMKDTEIQGILIKAGDWVTVPLVMANYDAAEFDDPLTAVFDREANRHLTFGGGAHRCLGSHLARAELRIAVEEWVNRVPTFQIKDGAEITAHAGVIGLNQLPLTWVAG